jgi:surfeit locus 1 family protein
MYFRGLEFRFRWVPTLVLALLVPLFVALGIWQLDRAEQKRELARLSSERANMPAWELSGQTASPELLRYRRLRATGIFESEGQIFIENRHEGNRIGFHVITPLHIQGSDMRVLVNRGWVPAARDGSPTAAPVPDGRVTVTGNSNIPSPPALILGGKADPAKQWGKRWPYLTVKLYAAGADYPVQPVVILESPRDPYGFFRNWPPELPKEGMHIGYAIQWFAFAFIAVAIWLRLGLVRRTEGGIGA